MKQVPLPLVKLNQSAIVLFVLFAIFFQEPILIYIITAIQLLGLLTEGKANPIFIPIRLFLAAGLKRAETQAAELNRFNNTIAVILLSLSGLFFVLGLNLVAYLFAGMVGLAAFVALCGYCIGCTIYYQYKRLRTTSK